MSAAYKLEVVVNEYVQAAPAMVAETLDFDAVYEKYVDFVWASLRGLGVQPAGIDDAVQDVFVALHRRLPDFEGRSTLKTFIFGIVVGVARNHRRAARRHNRLDSLQEADAVADARPSPLERTATSQALATLADLLSQLDDGKREILLLTEWEQMSAPEIAAALEIPVNTVYSRIRLARAEFEKLVAQRRGGIR